MSSASHTLYRFWADSHREPAASRAAGDASSRVASGERSSVQPLLPVGLFAQRLRLVSDWRDEAFDHQAFAYLQSLSRLASDRRPAASDLDQLESITSWLDAALPVKADDPAVALVATAWTYLLPLLANQLPSSRWLQCLQSILTQTDRAWNDADTVQLLPTLLWGCEIPLTLAVNMRHVDATGRLVDETRERLRLLVSDASVPRSAWLHHGGDLLPLHVAAVLRACHLLSTQKTKALRKSERNNIERHLRSLAWLTRADGSASFGNNAISLRTLLEAARSTLSLRGKTAALLDQAIADGNRSVSEAELPHPSKHEGEGQFAVMRGGWRRKATVLTVAYDRDPARLEICHGREQPLVSGDWPLSVYRDGEVVEFDQSWEHVCWHTDDDIDYLEIICRGPGFRVERQAMLVRAEQVIWLCDTLLADRRDRWRLEQSLPVSGPADGRPAADYHELRLLRPPRRGRTDEPKSEAAAIFLPVGLREQRVAQEEGGCRLSDAAIRIVAGGLTDRLMNPVVIGCGRKMAEAGCLWRHLTIADDLEIVDPAIARGFRVQIGEHQLLFYRSLGNLRRRTMFSQHLYTEFYVGRFDAADGEVESLLEVSQ